MVQKTEQALDTDEGQADVGPAMPLKDALALGLLPACEEDGEFEVDAGAGESTDERASP